VNHAGSEFGVATGGEDFVVETGALTPGEEDERLSDEGTPSETAAAVPCVTCGHRGAESFASNGLRFHAQGSMSKNRTREAEVEPAFGDHFPDALGGAFLEVDGDLWAEARVFLKQPAEEGLDRRTDVTEAQLALLTGGGTADAAEGLFQSLEEQRSFVHEDFAGGCQGDRALIAREQLDSQFLLQLLEGAAEGRLDNIEPARGAGKTQFLCDGVEITKVAQVHECDTGW
jgi:hypothetical protein